MGEVDLYLLGAGIEFPGQLTIDTLDVMEECAVIITNLPAIRLKLLPGDIQAKCRSVWPLYLDGRCRDENYRDVVNAVIEEMNINRPVAWLTPGNPIVFDSVTRSLLEQCRLRGWNSRVYAAVSSIDTLLAQLEYDPAAGLLIYEATSLLSRRAPVSPFVSMLLLQPGAFNSDRAALTLESVSVDFAPLVEYLKPYYPDEHLCAFVRSPETGNAPGRIDYVQLRELVNTPMSVVAGTTLFVPAVSKP